MRQWWDPTACAGRSPKPHDGAPPRAHGGHAAPRRGPQVIPSRVAEPLVAGVHKAPRDQGGSSPLAHARQTCARGPPDGRSGNAVARPPPSALPGAHCPRASPVGGAQRTGGRAAGGGGRRGPARGPPGRGLIPHPPLPACIRRRRLAGGPPRAPHTASPRRRASPRLHTHGEPPVGRPPWRA